MMSKVRELQAQMRAVKDNLRKEKRQVVLDIGPRIKAIRTSSGFTQATISDYLGMSRSTWCWIEAGKRGLTIANLIAFCQLFNVSADDVLGLNNVKERNDD